MKTINSELEELIKKDLRRKKAKNLLVGTSGTLLAILENYSKVYDLPMTKVIKIFLWHGIAVYDIARKNDGLPPLIENLEINQKTGYLDNLEEVEKMIEEEIKTVVDNFFAIGGSNDLF